MKTPFHIIASIAAALFAVMSAGAYAAQDKQSGNDAKKEVCFKMHAKLMSKPALMNINDCWRVHAYLMDR